MPSSRIVPSSAFAFACALGLAEPAFAQTTYRLALSGEVDHVVDCWESVPQCSGPHDIQYGWGGILTVVIDSAANGSYTGPDLESVTFAGNIGSFTLAWQQPDRFYVATVTDGRVSSLELNPFLDNTPDTLAWVSVDGLNASYVGSGNHHYGSTTGTATLTPIPEPAPTALWLAGLAAGAVLRRRQAWASGQRGLTSNA